jgi:putative membrane protein
MATQLHNPYERFSSDELILRDELAIDRTILANERTLLSYIRTALAFAVTGGGIIKFLDGTLIGLLGAGVIVCAAGIAALGVIRYQHVSRRICTSRGAAPSLPRTPPSPH